MAELKTVGKPVEKIDSLALATGAERFADDFDTGDTLHCGLLYATEPHAEILSIDTSAAEKAGGVVDILHHMNVPRVLHTTAGQGFPEPSPYDCTLFDNVVRFVGDRVALVAAETPRALAAALSKIRVEYKPLDTLFDAEVAREAHAPRVHASDEHAKIPVVYKPEENLAAEIVMEFGDPERGFDESDFIEEQVYRTQRISHSAIEPHAARAYFDERGRLVIVSTTQVPFHARRIVSNVVGIPIAMIRVKKPRIGGGFGGKQEVILEPLVAAVAWRNRRPARMVLSRKEVFTSARTKHSIRVRLKTGVMKDGSIRAMEMDGLLNAGAYGTHALTVLSNLGSKTLPMFNKIEHMKFHGSSVYTNLPMGGAYRGYGATQGYFAFNQHIDMIARACGLDVLDYIKRWHIREGETSQVFEALGEGTEGVAQHIRSCKLDECIDRGADAIGWYKKRDKRIKAGAHGVCGVGAAVSMQGSAIPRIDMASAYMKMNEDGSFNLAVGATDIGTGSDTVLAQIAAEVLCIPVEKLIVYSSDTDHTPFDTGAYASSTTYLSGGAVLECALSIRDQVLGRASLLLEAEKEQLLIRDEAVYSSKTDASVSYREICESSLYSRDQFQIQAFSSKTADLSPPPFMAQFAEVEVDKSTGRVQVVKLVSAIDCGQPVNPVLVEGQVEGAAVNGMGMALCEEYLFDPRGRMLNPGFWDYKLLTAADLPEMQTYVIDSHEETGPFGAKSAGEIAINGPAPAIANAIFDAVGVRMFELPMTPERVWNRLREVKQS
jgi:CO/xanthine dehydrogenase Mo-binding subunit